MSPLRTCLLLCLWSIACQGGEATPVAPPTVVPANVVVSVTPDLREALASTTQERDQLAGEIERLGHQRSLLLVVVGLLMGAVTWLARSVLISAKNKPLSTDSMREREESEPFPDLPEEVAAATTVTIRKNATITIRNGATQREEVSGQVQTRRFFTATEARRAQLPRRESTTSDTTHEESTVLAPGASAPTSDQVPAAAPEVVTPPSVAPRTARTTRTAKVLDVSEADLPADLQPSTERMLRSPIPEAPAPTPNAPRRPITVRVDHQSDRLEAVEVSVKPGTTGIFRRQAFTLLEVMLSLALLATVLSSVIASIYTLHHSRMLALEESQSQELGRLFIERIMSEPWGNLHGSLPDSVWRANYAADDAKATPLTAQFLQDKKVFENMTALADLKIFIEYYPYQALEKAIRNHTTMAIDKRQGWRDRTMAFRIVIDWRSLDGIRRQNSQLFARSE